MADMIDEDFKAFCKELKKTSPDPDKIKAGIEKYGFAQLSDSQKAMFQAAIFPKPTPRGKKDSEKLGFKNLDKINHTLHIMQDLYAGGAISKEDMSAFLTEPQRIEHKDENGEISYRYGKTLLAEVALNTYAIEFKDARFDKKLKEEGISDDLRSDLTKSRKKLYDNSQTAVEIQETLGKLDADLLYEAFNKEDVNTGRRFRYSDLAKKSFMMKDNLEKAERYAAQNQAESPRNRAENAPADEAVRFGGMPENSDILTFSAQPNELNVSTNTPPPPQTNDDEKPENSAMLEDAKRDSKHGRPSFEFTPVSEQDLIKYLYNVWFLGLINWTLKKAFKTLDGGIDYLCGDSGKTPTRRSVATRAPQASGSSQQTPAAPATGSSNAQEMSPEAKEFNQQMKQMIDLTRDNHLNEFRKIMKDTKSLKAILQCIQDNIGKDPSKWTAIDGFNPTKHLDFIKKLNKSFFANKALFRGNLATLMKNPQILSELFDDKKIRMCAALATIDYIRKNPDKKLDGNSEAAEKIHKDTMIKFKDMVETVAQIINKEEIKFKHDNNLRPDAELSKDQLKVVSDKAAIEIETHFKDMCYAGGDLTLKLCEHHAATDATQKQLLEQDIRVKASEFDKIYDKYRSPEDEIQPTETRKVKKSEPMGLVEAAHAEQAGEAKNQAWEGDINSKKAPAEAERSKNTQRKVQIKDFKRRIERKYQIKQARIQKNQGPRE